MSVLGVDEFMAWSSLVCESEAFKKLFFGGTGLKVIGNGQFTTLFSTIGPEDASIPNRAPLPIARVDQAARSLGARLSLPFQDENRLSG
jgi:hypothetical protein